MPKHQTPAKQEQLAAAMRAQRDGHTEAAISIYRALLQRHPGDAVALANMATLLRRTGDQAGAIAAMEEALRNDGGNAEIWFNSANLLRDVGQSAKAESAYRKALDLRPALHQAHTNLAGLLERLQRVPEAMQQHRLALAVDARNLPSLRALARLAHAAGAFEESLQCFQAADAVQPGHADTLLGLGVVIKELGRNDEAVACWEGLLHAHPRFAAAHNNLGALLRLMRKPLRAEAHLREAVRLAPNDGMAAANLAHALIDIGRIREAERIARGIVERDTNDAQGHLMVGFAQTYQGRVDDAITSFLQAHRCMPTSALVISNTLFASQYSAALDGTRVKELHQRLAPLITPAAPARSAWPNERSTQRRLKIGYLSADLRGHPVSLFLEPILAHHDAQACTVYCYSTTHAPDVTTRRLQGLVSHWRDAHGWSDQRLVQAISDDRIDILVDLAGHTAQNRAGVLRAHPAPIQALYIGYPGTSGLPEMDYLIADERVCPTGSAHLYTERIARAAGSFWCYGAPESAPAVAPPPCLRNGFVTFGSFNALQKMSAEVYRVWARVLLAVPGSRLVLKSLAFADPDTGAVVRRHFELAGVDGSRVDVLPPSDSSELLAHYAMIDIALDPFPYNGGTTTCDALWMGVPVVAVAGERFCARMGVSLLHSVGMDDLAGETLDDYVHAATKLAADPGRLQALRSELRARMSRSALGDGQRAARDLEDVYEGMWRDYLDATSADA